MIHALNDFLTGPLWWLHYWGDKYHQAACIVHTLTGHHRCRR